MSKQPCFCFSEGEGSSRIAVDLLYVRNPFWGHSNRSGRVEVEVYPHLLFVFPASDYMWKTSLFPI